MVDGAESGEAGGAAILVTPEGGLVEFPTMPADGTRSLSILAAAAAMMPGTVASMNLGLQPILFGAMVEAGRITPAELGRIATLEILALAAGSILTPRILPRVSVKLTVLILALGLALTNIAAFWAGSVWAIAALKTLSGLLAGGLMGATIYLITHTRQPDRMNAVFIAISTVPQMVGNYLLASVLNPAFGPYSGFGVMAALAVVAGASAAGLPPTARRQAPSGAPSRRGSLGLAAVLALLAVIVENAAIGAVWDFLEQVGHLGGLSHQTAGVAVAGLLGFQLIGAMVCAWVGWRLDNRTMLLLVSLLLGFNAIAINYVHGDLPYIAASCLFGFIQILLYPYGIKLLIELDQSRQAAMLLTPMSFLGTSLGPFICSWFVRPADVSAAYAIAFLAMLATLLIYIAIFVISPRRLRVLATERDAASFAHFAH